MNRVYLIGRITAKPELNYTASNMAVTKFTIAVDRGKDKGADFIRVTAFDRQAENICRYMDKGRMIAIEGRIQTGSYKGKDGKTVYTTDVIVDRSEFLGSASQSAEEIEQKAKDLFNIEDNYESTTDDIPF